MNLYHGTSDKHLDSILSHGLKPRGRRKGNWDSYPSRPDLVYLTTAYAPYFAWHAADDRKGERALLVEVDSQRLSTTCLFPDEDFVAQAISQTEGKPLGEVHPRVRDAILYYGDLHADSIKHLGNVAHRGPVPGEAITRYATIDLSKQQDLSLVCMDPTVSLINYRFCGARYRSIIAWIFGDRPDFDAGHGVTNDRYLPLMEQLHPGYADNLKRLWANRDGIDVVVCRKDR